jgi:hypothetical protein
MLFADAHAVALGGAAVGVMCRSKESRSSTWRGWKDWKGWSPPTTDGPIHDNKRFITRYANGATVRFRIAAEVLL